uniref:CLN6 transmembrane ER protein b n=1 Tax=Sphaeramia orbicularis TaxID=375764 RepID=A0A672YK84_9TELE
SHQRPWSVPVTRLKGSGEMEVVLTKPRFHLDLWIAFTVQNWLLDVGRPVVMLLLPVEWFPLSRPCAAEYLHILYNITTPLILLKLLERSPRTLPSLVVHLGIIAVVMGTSLHMVVDTITLRLLQVGYQLHLSIRENPLMTNLKPSSLTFPLSCPSRYVPLFLVLFLFFSGCFYHKKQEKMMPPAAWMLLLPNAAYYWYLVTEGQTFILFIFTFFAMTATVMHQRRRGLVPNSNGLFMLYSFSAALFLVAIWVICLWNDSILRRKHPGLIYVPQPRAVYTLHLRTNTQT